MNLKRRLTYSHPSGTMVCPLMTVTITILTMDLIQLFNLNPLVVKVRKVTPTRIYGSEFTI